jgi:hypothetical protein
MSKSASTGAVQRRNMSRQAAGGSNATTVESGRISPKVETAPLTKRQQLTDDDKKQQPV